MPTKTGAPNSGVSPSATGRVIQGKRPHSTDQHWLVRGRRPKRLSDIPKPVQRSQSERIEPQIAEVSDNEKTMATQQRPTRPRAATALGPVSAAQRPHSISVPVRAATVADEDSSDSSEEDEPTTPTEARPHALSFLQEDSLAITMESMEKAALDREQTWSPRSASSSSGGSASSGPSEGTDITTPDRSVNGSVNGEPTPVTSRRTGSPMSGQPWQHQRAKETRAHRYGTPEMSRGSANLPHIPPSELTPRVGAIPHGYVSHLPRAEKLPQTGYDLLASRLSGGRGRRRSSSGSLSPRKRDETTVKPIYRRFEALNHRLLLHLQDELCELEEQLHRLDTADTQNRRLQNGILPASRRRESATGGELQFHKTDILGKIGYKLGQYNHVLTSFRDTQSLHSADEADVDEYRAYLATENPIAEIETRFLDPADDLVCLAQPKHELPMGSGRSYSSYSDDALTPMPRKMSMGFSAAMGSPQSTRASSRMRGRSPARTSTEELQEAPMVMSQRITNAISSFPIVAGLLVAMLTSPWVTDLAGRTAVALVTAIAVAAIRRNMEGTQ